MRFTFFIIASLIVAVFAMAISGERGEGQRFAQAQQAPAVVTAANADSIGTVNLSWDALPEVSEYTVGWLANEDYVANLENNVWIKYFAYSNVGDVREWTVNRLTPGIDYWFITCGNLNSDAPVCTGWTSLSLTAPPAAICPTGEPVPAPDAGDYDADDDGLIEIINLAQLDAIRYDSDGDGVPDDASADAYAAAFPGAVEGMGCSSTTGCKGYELMAPLDFDTNGNGEADAGDAYWNNGDGWEPINYQTRGPVTIGFDGNGHAISNLYISRSTTDNVGLFSVISADIQNVVLEGVNVTGRHNVGALAGENLFNIYNSSASGEVAGFGGNIGGLVGANANSTGWADVRRSSADVSVTGLGTSNGFAGGLTGILGRGTISDSIATGDVDAADYTSVGGLAGGNFGSILSSTASGSVTGRTEVGNLVGNNQGTVTNSQGTGQVTCSECP
ncbi:MAG: hypothetical protein F4X64_15210 [Chloroflexi bacterium]|nr:hypothetical protein [Chloroflexota bacterium]